MRAAKMILVTLLVAGAAAPAQADDTASSQTQNCTETVCAGGAATIRIWCDVVAEHTVACGATAFAMAKAGPAQDGSIQPFAGRADLQLYADCEWFVLGGFTNDCSGFTRSSSVTWETHEFCCEYAMHQAELPTVTYSSPEPFCLVYVAQTSAYARATSTVAGLVDVDEVEARAFTPERYDEACA